ncbi:putative sugar transporter [Trypanosoma vivax]|uniref:Putative sugar transporter n=1 Tax=Trypanosoma vivax (strain Y486) TaxID=1055687 RepID=G0UB81_TRYVY|nr:putative sugar transporter [Trypanosoma vivax]CCC53068.1 putative sugar transporter [Trypanosoma vivax Y486]
MRWSVKIFAALGGFLFGYDTSVINGALFQMKVYFPSLDQPWLTGLVVSIAIIGAFLGATAAGFISARWGRRYSIALADIMFTLGSVLMSVAVNVEMILAGRFIVGLGIGICSATIPVYLAEITPATSRGSDIVFNNVCLTGGQLVASAVTALLVEYTSEKVGWRVAFGLGALPSAIQFIGLLMHLPESPRWCLARGDTVTAHKIAEEFNIDISECPEDVAIITDYHALFHRSMRRRMFIGCFLHIVQQTSGINTIMYYSSTILKTTGFNDPKSPVFLSIPLTAINTIFSIFGAFTVDRWGRRLLLQISACACFVATVCMTIVGFMLGEQIPEVVGGWVFLALMGIYLVFFAPGLGAMPWVIIGEIFPTRLRTPAASVATMCNWASNAVVSQLFPVMMDSIGVGGTFCVLCVCIAGAAIFIHFCVMELKGLTLEEINNIFDPYEGSSGSSETEMVGDERQIEGEHMSEPLRGN